MLRLVVMTANFNFPPSSKKIEPDTFVLATFRAVKKQTRVIRKNQRPFWNETLEWYLDETPLNSSSVLEVEVRDAGKIAKDRFFGYSVVYLKPLAMNLTEPLFLNEQLLLDNNHQPTKFTITLKILYLPLEEAEPVHQAQNNTGIWENAGERRGDAMVMKKHLPDRKYDFQIFFFNFYESPSVLFDEILHILVLNTEASRSQAIIGIFRLELGTVYNSRDGVCSMDNPNIIALKKFPSGPSLGITMNRG